MGIRSSKSFSRLGGVILLAFSALSLAQNVPTPAATTPQDSSGTGSSLAEAARKAKAQKAAHATKVFTDEDMEAASGPLPRLKMDGADNSDDVVAAMTKYRATHTPQQTEEVVHAWFDRYDQMLAAAMKESVNINTLRNVNSLNGYDLCAESSEPQECRSRQTVNMMGMRSDSNEMTRNMNLEGRIRPALFKIQVWLMQNNLHYDWFKVRTTDQF